MQLFCRFSQVHREHKDKIRTLGMIYKKVKLYFVQNMNCIQVYTTHKMENMEKVGEKGKALCLLAEKWEKQC